LYRRQLAGIVNLTTGLQARLPIIVIEELIPRFSGVLVQEFAGWKPAIQIMPA
jgi:hypothetical protein